MDSFLQNVARSLYSHYGEDVSSLRIILPNMRSRLFFMDALSEAIDRPVWQPRYATIDEVMSSVSGISPVDKTRAVVELYKVYSRYHTESFDSFYFWGELLLSDFDQIDKYMIDAQMLFTNLRDLKAVGNDFSYLSKDQIDVIARFWASFGQPEDYSQHQRRFMAIWNTLLPVYDEFRSVLSGKGLGYGGMIYRDAALKLRAGQGTVAKNEKWVVVGFNALSESEKTLLDHLKNVHEADFFWDYDDYYMRDRSQEAGLFVRENVSRYPQPHYFLNRTDNFSRPKTLTAISVASDSLQCKYASTFIGGVRRSGAEIDKKTAIVLTNEDLLVPLLYSLPEDVEEINVTMGYPLRQTLAYSFLERLIKLQSHIRIRGGEEAFYHNDVLGLLRHPYVVAADAENADRIADDIVRRSRIYARKSLFDQGPLIARMFRKMETWEQMADYVIDILSDVYDVLPESLHEDARQNMLRGEYFGSIAENVRKLSNSLTDCGVEISVPVFCSLLRRSLQMVRIPYSGEPLRGLQVMGILETRNLDFEHVMIMSMNDDHFPGNPSATASFIPYNLRLAYGLPTPQHHEGVYAYYFYRLLQRASRVDMVYCSKNDESSSGEQSRYIYQLDYESPHEVCRADAVVDVNLSRAPQITIAKEGRVMERLAEFLEGGEYSLSPTAFHAFIECPMKFYFRSVERLKAEDEVNEEIDLPMFGTILHRSMEILYEPLVGVYQPADRIGALINSPAVYDATNRAVNEVYFRGDDVAEDQYEGALLMVRDIVCRYINGNILPYDARMLRYTIIALEMPLHAEFSFTCAGRELKIRFAGKADRVERLDNGTVRIVDYKTGSPHAEFAGMEQLFSEIPKDRNAAALQTFLYSFMARSMQSSGELEGGDVCPVLYYVRNMNLTDYSPLLQEKGVGDVESYRLHAGQFEELLAEKLSELYDTAVPFCQTADRKVCQYCDFKLICGRN